MKNTFHKGDEINIEEMPQGCWIFNRNDDNIILISSPNDAIMLIKSLEKMLKIQFPNKFKEYKNE